MTQPLFVFDAARDAIPVHSDEQNDGWYVTLPDDIRRHAIQSMRLGRGDEIQLSDGEGLRIIARIDDRELGTAVVTKVGRDPRPVTRLTLVQALAKQGHDEQAIDMATQIGADAIIPWRSNRSIAKWKSDRTGRRWSQILIAASEQSRRSWVPELGDAMDSRHLAMRCTRSHDAGDVVVVLHQDATASWESVEEQVGVLAQRCLDDGRSRTVHVIVGPEGGISDEEIAAFTQAGACCCTLGTNILRASTAGPVALSLLSRALGRFA